MSTWRKTEMADNVRASRASQISGNGFSLFRNERSVNDEISPILQLLEAMVPEEDSNLHALQRSYLNWTPG